MAGKTTLTKNDIAKMKEWRKARRTLRNIAAFFGKGPHTVLWHVDPNYRLRKLKANKKWYGVNKKRTKNLRRSRSKKG